MVWIVALVAAWLVACLLLAALARAASHADRMTPEHLARSAAARNLRVWPMMSRSRSSPQPSSRPRPRPRA
jgi:hypothetical protein